MRNRSYTEEFKREAVALAQKLGSSSRAAQQLGIPKVNLYDWGKKLEEGTLKGAKPSQPNSKELEELRQLRREVIELKKVNHILKAAAAFFSQDHLK